MAVTFPANPADGDTVTFGSVIYTFRSTPAPGRWTAAGTSAAPGLQVQDLYSDTIVAGDLTAATARVTELFFTEGTGATLQINQQLRVGDITLAQDADGQPVPAGTTRGIFAVGDDLTVPLEDGSNPTGGIVTAGDLVAGSSERHLSWDESRGVLNLRGGSFTTSAGGSAGLSYVQGAPPEEAGVGSIFYRTSTDTYYIVLSDGSGGIIFRPFANGNPAGDLAFVGVNTSPNVANFPDTPTNTHNTSGTLDISSLNDDQWIIGYVIGAGGRGASGFNTFPNRAGGGGGGAGLIAVPKLVAGNNITYTVGNSPGVASTINFPNANISIPQANGAGGGNASAGDQSNASAGAGGGGSFYWPDTDQVFTGDPTATLAANNFSYAYSEPGNTSNTPNDNAHMWSSGVFNFSGNSGRVRTQTNAGLSGNAGNWGGSGGHVGSASTPTANIAGGSGRGADYLNTNIIGNGQARFWVGV